MSLFFSWQANSQQRLHQIKIHLEALVDTFVLKPVMDTLSRSGINLFRVISFFSARWKLLVRFQNQNKYQPSVANQTTTEAAYLSWTEDLNRQFRRFFVGELASQ